MWYALELTFSKIATFMVDLLIAYFNTAKYHWDYNSEPINHFSGTSNHSGISFYVVRVFSFFHFRGLLEWKGHSHRFILPREYGFQHILRGRSHGFQSRYLNRIPFDLQSPALTSEHLNTIRLHLMVMQFSKVNQSKR